MKKLIFFILAGLFVLAGVLVAGCVSGEEEHSVTPTLASTPTANMPNSNPSITSEPAKAVPESEKFETTNIDTGVIDTIITEGEDGTGAVIVLNRVTKTATLEMTSPIEMPKEDAPKFMDMSSMDIAARIMQQAFFDPNRSERSQEDETDFILDGYTVTKLTIKFVEEGTNTPISDYVITGLTENDMVITKH